MSPKKHRREKNITPHGIPEVVIIKGKKWRVKLVRTLEKRLGAVGLCCFDIRTIKIDSALSREDQETTLIHEILHALWPNDIVGGRTEERLIEALDEEIYQLFLRNKK